MRIYALEGLGICKMRTASPSSFVVHVSLGFMTAGIPKLVPRHL